MLCFRPSRVYLSPKTRPNRTPNRPNSKKTRFTFGEGGGRDRRRVPNTQMETKTFCPQVEGETDGESRTHRWRLKPSVLRWRERQTESPEHTDGDQNLLSSGGGRDRRRVPNTQMETKTFCPQVEGETDGESRTHRWRLKPSVLRW
jgi:hypothetical protein